MVSLSHGTTVKSLKTRVAAIGPRGCNRFYSGTLKDEKLNEIKNVIGFVENCTVSAKTFDFYTLM